ncbi:MAG: Ulp1 protease [Amphiamblys sp. WSBS2006]|nr:MAG: Ulp1 protease [Amphiamblys sp. WSBS2006]
MTEMKQTLKRRNEKIKRKVKGILGLSTEEEQRAKGVLCRDYPHIDLDGLGAAETLAEKFNIAVKKKDAQTLLDTHWLNDEVVNFFFQLIQERSESKTRKCFCFNSFFFTKLTTCGVDSVMRWNAGFEKCDAALIPVNIGNTHWTLLMWCRKRASLFFYDSLQSGLDEETVSLLVGYFRRHNLSVAFHLLDGPAQKNTFDCGVFMCAAAESLSLGRKMYFAPSDAPKIRKAMLHFIWRKSL